MEDTIWQQLLATFAHNLCYMDPAVIGMVVRAQHERTPMDSPLRVIERLVGRYCVRLKVPSSEQQDVMEAAMGGYSG